MKERCTYNLPPESVKAVLDRLARIEGQIRGIQGMIREGRSCEEILVQISAVKSALSSVAYKFFEDHVEYCIKPSVAEGNVEAFSEFIEAVKTLLKK